MEQITAIKKEKDFAIASLVCGILIWVPLFNTILGPLALAFGIVSMKRIKQSPEKYGGKWMAITGFILGVIATVFLFITIYIKIFKPELLLASK